ncbi:MAG: Maf-like protein YhdE [Phycisphaerae bacterium]|nr:Maf-like protein YhdE [Phycisphaerae bacterium]
MACAAPPLILASASPRRSELLATLNVPFLVRASPLAEPDGPSASVPPAAWAMAMAYFKARAVAEHAPDVWTLGADTVVACTGYLLGKPRDAPDAERMLRLQMGRESEVITGVCLVRCRKTGEERQIAAARSVVHMRHDEQVLRDYLASGDWAGKAGAYGIQNVGDVLVERLTGSFSNVVGLPLELTRTMLDRLAGRTDPEPPPQSFRTCPGRVC